MMTSSSSKYSFLLALVASVFAIAMTLPAESQAADAIGGDKDLGIGVGRGTLTSGITGKYYLDRQSAIQLFVGSLGGYGFYGCGACGFAISGDYINEFSDLADAPEGRLFLGAGGGGAIYSGYGFGGSGFAINGVLELGWHFADFPLEIVVDVRPGLAFGRVFDRFDRRGNGVGFIMDFGPSFRFFF